MLFCFTSLRKIPLCVSFNLSFFSPSSVSATGMLSANSLQLLLFLILPSILDSSYLCFSYSDLSIHAGGPINLACGDDHFLLLSPCFPVPIVTTPWGTQAKPSSCKLLRELPEVLKPESSYSSDSSPENAKRVGWSHALKISDKGRMITRKERKDTVHDRKESRRGEEQSIRRDPTTKKGTGRDWLLQKPVHCEMMQRWKAKTTE